MTEDAAHYASEFYHGLPQDALLMALAVLFYGPSNCSSSAVRGRGDVRQPRRANQNGIVIALKNDGNIGYFFNCVAGAVRDSLCWRVRADRNLPAKRGRRRAEV